MSNGNSQSGSNTLRIVAEEAADWYLLFDEDSGSSDSERQRFVEWLQRSPHHVEEFLRVGTVHACFKEGTATGLPNVNTLVEQALSNVVAMDGADSIVSASQVTARGREHQPVRSTLRRYALGAGLAASLAIIGVYFLQFLPNDNKSLVYQTALGEQRSIVLEDGSVVELNTKSRIRINYSANKRLIALLYGEAVFDIAHDPLRPFRVISAAAEVDVVGTQFNVYQQKDRTLITVVNGRVVVKSNKSGQQKIVRQLARGDQVFVANTGELGSVVQADPDVATAWMNHKLVFDGDTLTTVVQEINRYNRSKLQLGSKQLGQRRISGVFNSNNPKALAAFLATVGGLRVERSPSGWQLYDNLNAPDGGEVEQNEK